MQDKRIFVLVSLALLVASALADMTPREKWVRWGIDECNGDPKCWTELVEHRDEKWDYVTLTPSGASTSQSHPKMPSSYVDTRKGAPRSTSEL
ncbi:hypothetical protein BKA57DRAFT_478151 [Linnemannia elongata]|nr:hypothetical protein BKA57DRAFT_478151 [Linnemannia elongata]